MTSVEKAAKRLEEVQDKVCGTTTPVNLYRTEDCKDKVRQQLAFLIWLGMQKLEKKEADREFC